MSAQITRPLVVFTLTLLAAGLALGVSDHPAVADDCRNAPNSPAPANSHWYYRTDRTQQRQCWHLGTNESSQPRAVPTAADAAMAPPLASFKEFMAQRGGAKLSDQEVEKLYAEFLEWNRGTKSTAR
jgi:hypothetical protein